MKSHKTSLLRSVTATSKKECSCNKDLSPIQRLIDQVTCETLNNIKSLDEKVSQLQTVSSMVQSPNLKQTLEDAVKTPLEHMQHEVYLNTDSVTQSGFALSKATDSMLQSFEQKLNPGSNVKPNEPLSSLINQ